MGELAPLYNTLNNPNRTPGSLRAAPGRMFTPADLGYSGEAVSREYLAEAIRAYLVDPNYVKSIAPKTAARIREWINSHPGLLPILQFNSLPFRKFAEGGRGSISREWNCRPPIRRISGFFCKEIAVGPIVRGWSRVVHMRQVASGLCLVGGLCLAATTLARAENCDADFLADVRPSYNEILLQREALNDIGSVGINPSSDAWVLFEEFAKRFVLVTADDQSSGRDIRSIVENGGGDRDALVFMLLNLFTWNGIDAESVHVYGDREPEPKRNFVVGNIDRILVYAPGLDQYFDPTLPLAGQRKEAGGTLVDGKPRIHFAYPAWRSAHGCPGSPIRGYYGRRNSDAVPTKTETPRGSGQSDNEATNSK